MGILKFLGSFSPTDFEYVTLEESGTDLVTVLSRVLIAVFALVAAIGIGYAIYLGFLLAKAEDSEKRKQAKSRIVKTLFGLFSIIILTSAFISNSFFRDIFMGTRDRSPIGAYKITLGGQIRTVIIVDQEFSLGYTQVNDNAPKPAKVVFYEGSEDYDPGFAGYNVITKARGHVAGQSINITAFFLNNEDRVLSSATVSIMVVDEPPPLPLPDPSNPYPSTPHNVPSLPSFDPNKPVTPGTGGVPVVSPGTGGTPVGNLRWPLNGTQYTSNFAGHFGAPRYTHLKAGSKVRYHAGIDIFQNAGSPVYAIADGVVSGGGSPDSRSTTIKLNDMVDIPGLGSYTIWACLVHIDPVGHPSAGGTRLQVGAKVTKGQLIGVLAPNGAKTDYTSPHLHLEISVTGQFSTTHNGNYSGFYSNPPPTLRQYEIGSGRLHPLRLFRPDYVTSVQGNKLPI